MLLYMEFLFRIPLLFVKNERKASVILQMFPLGMHLNDTKVISPAYCVLASSRRRIILDCI